MSALPTMLLIYTLCLIHTGVSHSIIGLNMKFSTSICGLAIAAISQNCAYAQDSQAKVPGPLKGKSVTVSYDETRKSKPEEGGEINTRKVPFKLILYVSAEGNLFNRLLAGRDTKSSDQTRGSKDLAQFADRETVFDGQKMSVSNTFGGGNGSRVIEASFDDSFSKCTATVVISVKGEYARRRLITGGFELLYSASTSDVTCAVTDGNALMN